MINTNSHPAGVKQRTFTTSGCHYIRLFNLLITFYESYFKKMKRQQDFLGRCNCTALFPPEPTEATSRQPLRGAKPGLPGQLQLSAQRGPSAGRSPGQSKSRSHLQECGDHQRLSQPRIGLPSSHITTVRYWEKPGALRWGWIKGISINNTFFNMVQR